jgi:hypothetical protein
LFLTSHASIVYLRVRLASLPEWSRYCPHEVGS